MKNFIKKMKMKNKNKLKPKIMCEEDNQYKLHFLPIPINAEGQID